MRINYLVSLHAAILALASLAAVADGTVYKCKDTQGGLTYQESPCKQHAQTVFSWAAANEVRQPDVQSDEMVNRVLIIKQSGYGHYFLNGTINGRGLTFVIDTGASSVALPREIAMSAQIYCRDKILMQTANGSASACTAIIPQLKFGPFLIKNAPATISPNLSQPLLGMSVLQQFRIEQENGEMRISVRN